MASGKSFVRVTGGQWDPYGVMSLADGEYKLAGPLREVLSVFEQYAPFESVLTTPPDRVWGIMLPNGSWTGMIGQIQREEVDIALGPFVLTPQRSNVCDFSVPLHHESWGILTPRPKLQNDMSGFLKPFTLQVWLLIIASLLNAGVAMASVMWAEGKSFRRDTNHIVSRAIMWSLTALSQESSEWLPKKDGGRLLVTTWLLASLVFMTSYSGILTAMLTLPRVIIKIDSLADLVSQSDLSWRVEDGSVILSFLKDSEDEVHQKTYAEMGPVIFDCLEETRHIMDGKFTAFCSVTSSKKAMDIDFSANGKCHLYITRGMVMSNALMGLAFRKNSKHIAKANHLIRSVLESGLWDKWLGDQLANASHCLHHPRLDRTDGIQPLSMDSFAGPLLFLLTVTYTDVLYLTSPDPVPMRNTDADGTHLLKEFITSKRRSSIKDS